MAAREEQGVSDAIAEFFGRLGEGGKEPALHAVTGTLRFDLTDRRGTEHWLVTVEEGGVRVSRRNGKADCVGKGDRGLFGRGASGRGGPGAPPIFLGSSRPCPPAPRARGPRDARPGRRDGRERRARQDLGRQYLRRMRLARRPRGLARRSAGGGR